MVYLTVLIHHPNFLSELPQGRGFSSIEQTASLDFLYDDNVLLYLRYGRLDNTHFFAYVKNPLTLKAIEERTCFDQRQVFFRYKRPSRSDV